MIGNLLKSAVHLGGAYGALRLKRLKVRILSTLISVALCLVFGLIAILFLFVLAFLALRDAYGAEAAALILFSTALILCVCIWIIHLVANRQPPESKSAELVSELKSQLPSSLALGMALGRQTKNLFTPKRLGLAALVTIGTVMASKPVETYQLGKGVVCNICKLTRRRRFR